MKEFDSDVNKSKVNKEKLNITDYELYPKEGCLCQNQNLRKVPQHHGRMVLSNNFVSMLFTVLRRVHPSSMKKGLIKKN